MKKRFVTRYKELRLVITPTHKVIVGASAQLVPGKSIQFMNGEFETENKEEIDFLMNHKDLNVVFHEAQTQEEMQEGLLDLAEKVKKSKAGRPKKAEAEENAEGVEDRSSL